MDNKIAVIYKTKYGATKRYAGWIALKLGADLYEVSDIRSKDLKEYDTIIYGGALYIGKIKGIKFIIDNYDSLKNKNVFIFMVGLKEVDEFYMDSIVEQNIPKEVVENIKTFYFRGKMDYKELNIKDKILMKGLQSSISKKSDEEISNDERIILNIQQSPVDYIDKKAIENLISVVYSNN